MKMLIVEDEQEIMALIANHFTEEGWDIYQATDGTEALEVFQQHSPFDTVILDWMLPKKNGLDVCRAIRQSSDVPILFLTAKTEEIDKLFGLEVGADDYITKPFSLRELSMRIRVILRRVQQAGGVKEEPSVIIRGSLHIFPEEFRVTSDGKEISLTRTEFRLLEMLATSPGRVFSRLQLLEKALGEEYAGYERSIDTHILNLRKKIEQDHAHPVYVLTVFGIGYKWGEIR